MKKIIKNLLIGLIIISAICGQPVFAAAYDLNSDVYNHLENWDTEFEISYYKSDVLDIIRDIAKKDDYLNRSLSKLVYERVGNRATVKVTYITTKEQEEYINMELQTIVDSIITNNMSDFDKIKIINKYLVDRYKYDDSLVSNNVYSALTTGKTTCQGYAMTAYKMLNLAGIENRIIIGDLDGVPHGWNLVKLDEKWYHLDVTNNDAVGTDRYFLKDDKDLRNDKFDWEANDYPECNKNYEEVLNNYKSYLDGNWYNNNGSWYFNKNTNTHVTGWNLINNNWYCFGRDGRMETGWIYYNGKWYYCYPTNGNMATNTIVNGYRIDSNGAWIA